MALPEVTITLDLADKVGDFDPKGARAWMTTNVDVIHDTLDNKTRAGSGNGDITDAGVVTWDVWTPGPGSNPASWQSTFYVDVRDRAAHGGRKLLKFGPYTITAAANIDDLADEQEVPPTYLSTVTQQLDGYVTSAANSAAVAQAAADSATAIAVGDADAALAAVAADTDSDFYAAQAATFGPRLSRTFAEREFPTLAPPTAPGTAHIVSAAVEQGTGKINYPCVVKVAGLIPGALFNYYAFTSADHGSGPGGIYLHGFNFHGEPWTYIAKVLTHPDAGALQCESPWVVYDDVTGLFRAYAQVKGTVTGKLAGQVTCVWTSPDCQTWTYVGISHDVEASNHQAAWTGNHTGYQKVAKIGGLWVSRGLIGGDQYSRKANYYSVDGLKFYTDRTQVAGRPDIPIAGRRILLDHFVQWDGALIGYGKLRGNGSGGTASLGSFAMGRITADGTDFAGRPEIIYTPATTGTTGENGDAADGHLFIEDGRAHLYYVSDPVRILYVTQES